jgi:hypothetical protein
MASAKSAMYTVVYAFRKLSIENYTGGEVELYLWLGFT